MPSVAIVYPGDRDTRRDATPDNNRFADLFAAFAARGVDAVPAVYHDDFADEVALQLAQVDVALVWVNPIHEGRDRSRLDTMLREVAARGTFVSAHPDVILTLGTKEVLYRTRELPWGSDVRLYRSLDELRDGLGGLLPRGPRVLKQYRGHSGNGVWKVELVDASERLTAESSLRVRHAERGSEDEVVAFGIFLERCARYFRGEGRMIDQEYQSRLSEGMTRCYLVHDRVAGFGHQELNALLPPSGDSGTAPQPGPRLYYPDTEPRFQGIARLLETEWLPAAMKCLGLSRDQLPILWDCDFLLGRPRGDGSDSYVLCEINVSSVAPYPPSAVARICDATIAKLHSRKQSSLTSGG
jgi:hypothetical protein